MVSNSQRFNKLKNEYNELKNDYINFAIEKENRLFEFQNTHIMKNKNGDISVLNSDLKSYLKDYFNSVIQRLIYNKKLASENDLIPFFITFTLPSHFHPFKNRLKQLNENFKFNTINEAIPKAYETLKDIFRYFYNVLKKNNRTLRKLGKNIKYNGFFEFHKSYIPHYHLLIYVPAEFSEYIYKVYNQTLEHFGMNKKSNKIIRIENKKNGNEELNELDGAVLYISKYISKNLKNLFEFPDNLEDLRGHINEKTYKEYKRKQQNLYLYMGWKFKNNIRIFRGNQTKIGVLNYKKIYTRLDKNEKNELLEKAKNNNSCLLYEIEQISERITIINDLETKKRKRKAINDDGTLKRFTIIEEKDKTKKFDYYNVIKLFKNLKVLNIKNNKKTYKKYIQNKEVIKSYDNSNNLFDELLKVDFEKINETIKLEFEIMENKEKFLIDELAEKDYINYFNEFFESDYKNLAIKLKDYIKQNEKEIIKILNDNIHILKMEVLENLQMYKTFKKVNSDFYDTTIPKAELNKYLTTAKEKRINFLKLLEYKQILNDKTNLYNFFYKLVYKIKTINIYNNELEEIYSNSDYNLISLNYA